MSCLLDLRLMLMWLRCYSLLVEGGPQTQRAFIERGLWDEAIEELSPLTLGSGVPAPRLPVGIPRKVTTHWGHTLTTWRNS